MTNTPKIVISSTLDNADWGPTTVISGDVSATLARLKEQPGRDITVGASGTLVRSLLRERLLDELQLLVHPVIAGTGARLFEGYGESLPLTLTHCHAHGNGIVTRSG
jgi:dihydrofolate reductase